MSAELDAAADSLAPAYATGDSADSVTQKFALPNKAGTGVSVSWKSSDDSALGLSGYSWDEQTSGFPATRGTSRQPQPRARARRTVTSRSRRR